jgi:hypothetical protein
LTPGRYIVCAHNPGAGWLDPCFWTRNPPVILVESNRDTNTVVALLESAEVRVRIVDTGNALNKTMQEYYEPTVDFFLADTATQIRYPVPLIRKTSGQATYELAVPKGRTYRLDTSSADVALQHSNGQAIGRTGSSQTFTLTGNGQQQQQFVFVATGRR